MYTYDEVGGYSC